MNIYENVVILNPSLNEEEMKSAVDKITDLIKNSGGDVLKIDNWGKKKLAYELNKQRMGVYVIFLFKSPAPVVKKIEDYFKVFDPVLKFMVVKLGKKQIAALPENLAKNVAGIPAASQETASSEQKAGA
ncbi:MAG: 30S ribosomal protein S6 [Nitrospirae bacterium]|nr:30S ribosomal protein S6 [Nitrospirota bacterium]MDA8213982.1 30S ribosomal protein S6 [Nitrospiraceae bacterium]MDA8337864.1 30S ribosomal protein S6 [Nitrospiraceae bacterium]